MTDDEQGFEISGAETLGVPAARMTGRAWIDHLATGAPPARVRLVKAFFEPLARTVWHRHWDGQLLHVVAGILLYQERGQPARVFRAGESLACPPGVWHWHGADATHFLTQIAVITVDEHGQDADWGEPVTEEAYTQAEQLGRTAF